MNTHDFLDLCRDLNVNTIKYTTNEKTADRWSKTNGVDIGILSGDIFVEFYDYLDEQYIEFAYGELRYASVDVKTLPIELFLLVDRLGSGRINFWLADDCRLPNGYRVIDYEK